MTLVYPAIGGRPIILAVVQNLIARDYFLMQMLLDTGADQTCFPSKLASIFGHDNSHPGIVKDVLHGIGGVSTSYLHSVQLSLIDPKKSTQKKPVLAWTATEKTAVFVENLDCGFGLIGMDLIRQWKHLSFEPNKHGMMIRIVIDD